MQCSKCGAKMKLLDTEITHDISFGSIFEIETEYYGCTKCGREQIEYTSCYEVWCEEVDIPADEYYYSEED